MDNIEKINEELEETIKKINYDNFNQLDNF